MFDLKKVRLADACLLADISVDTFREAYASMFEPSDLESYISSGLSEEVLKAEIQDPKISFWIAKTSDEIAGYIKFELKDPKVKIAVLSGKITRIYVKKKYYGSGLADLLMQKHYEIARENGMQGVWLTVWEKNLRAIRFYEKSGFEKVGFDTFQLGSVLNTDYVMFRKLPT
jgi:ribosomal protein S18 acetylase RimI-like enzyme